jgi:phage-related baseplate assembly protein
MSLIDLPDIQFCEIDTQAVEASLVSTYETITARTLYPGNPERLFLEAVAYIIAQQRFLIDYAAKMNLVSLSAGDYLDHLGALLGTIRLPSSSATTTVRFSVSAPLSYDVTIPKGTRVSPDGTIMFATDLAGTILAGQTYIDIAATCTETGTSGNGFLPGSINLLVDNVAHIARVENTTLSMFGSETESDTRFRSRVQLAPEKLSTCGTIDGYRWWVMSCSDAILDVGVWSPSEGRVNVCPLMTDGSEPSADLLTTIAGVLNDERVRPLTDVVTVQAPDQVEYDIDLTYYILHSHQRRVPLIQQSIASKITAYETWQRSALGRSIRPTYLVELIQSIDGVQRVEITSPDYVSLDTWQVAKLGTKTINYGGLTSE